jgi:hypothetical protein
MVVALASAGCAGSKKKDMTPVGSSHAPYPAKPEYLGTRALPDPSTLRVGTAAAPIHVSAPVEAPVEDAPVEQAAEPASAPQTEQAAPQQGGSLTVAPSNEAPLPNRLPDQQQPWQPQILAPNPPSDNP